MLHTMRVHNCSEFVSHLLYLKVGKMPGETDAYDGVDDLSMEASAFASMHLEQRAVSDDESVCNVDGV